MSDELAGLVVSLVVCAFMQVIAILIRVRGPIGLVKNVDWSRVSDPSALGQFVSLILCLMGALILAHGIILFAFRTDQPLRNASTTAFVIFILLLTITLLIGQQRYQDKPAKRRSG